LLEGRRAGAIGVARLEEVDPFTHGSVGVVGEAAQEDVRGLAEPVEADLEELPSLGAQGGVIGGVVGHEADGAVLVLHAGGLVEEGEVVVHLDGRAEGVALEDDVAEAVAGAAVEGAVGQVALEVGEARHEAQGIGLLEAEQVGGAREELDPAVAFFALHELAVAEIGGRHSRGSRGSSSGQRPFSQGSSSMGKLDDRVFSFSSKNL
jgi:hypothetical protein